MACIPRIANPAQARLPPAPQSEFSSSCVHAVSASRALRFLSGGRFKGESGFAWGWAVVVGGLILLTPFVACIAWLIHRGAHLASVHYELGAVSQWRWNSLMIKREAFSPSAS